MKQLSSLRVSHTHEIRTDKSIHRIPRRIRLLAPTTPTIAQLPSVLYLVLGEDSRIKLDVPRLVHTVHVSKGRGDAEVRAYRRKCFIHRPDLRHKRSGEIPGAQSNIMTSAPEISQV